MKILMTTLALATGWLAGPSWASEDATDRRCAQGVLSTWFQPAGEAQRRLQACSATATADAVAGDPELKVGQRYQGIWDADQSGWVVPPRYQNVRYFNDSVIYARREGQPAWQLLAPREGQVQTVYRWHFAYHWPKGGRNSALLAFTDAQHTRAVLFDRQGRSTAEIVDIDPQPLKSAEGFALDPAFGGSEAGGVWVRHRQGDAHHYQAWDDRAQAISERYPVAEIWLALMEHRERGSMAPPSTPQDRYVLVHQRADGSLWPLLLADNRVALPRESSRGFDGYLRQAGSASAPPRLKLVYQRFENGGESSWASFAIGMKLQPGYITALERGYLKGWKIVESPDIPQGGVAYLQAEAPDRVRVLGADGQAFPGALGAQRFASLAEAEDALGTAQQSLAEHRQRVQQQNAENLQRLRAAMAGPQPGSRQAAAPSRDSRYDALLEHGPNPVSLSQYGIETETYCALRGPRCEEYRRTYRQWQDAHNRGVASANQARLLKLYNQGVNQAEVRARTECFRRAADSKREAVAGRQDWHYSSEGCKPRP